MRVLVTSDYRTLSQQAAHIVGDGLKANPELTLGLPTGSTPLGMYEELVRQHQTEGLDFSRARTFNLDEYIGLPADHPQSYHAYMRRHFFDHVNLAAENIDIPNGSLGVDVDAERVEVPAEQVGRLDAHRDRRVVNRVARGAPPDTLGRRERATRRERRDDQKCHDRVSDSAIHRSLLFGPDRRVRRGSRGERSEAGGLDWLSAAVMPASPMPDGPARRDRSAKSCGFSRLAATASGAGLSRPGNRMSSRVESELASGWGRAEAQVPIERTR